MPASTKGEAAAGVNGGAITAAAGSPSAGQLAGLKEHPELR